MLETLIIIFQKSTKILKMQLIILVFLILLIGSDFVRSLRSIVLPMSTFNLTGDFLMNKYLNAAIDLA